MKNPWIAFLKEEKKLARDTSEKFWEALPKSLTEQERAQILVAAQELGMKVERSSKTGPLRITWN
jgi:hypothetical protein